MPLALSLEYMAGIFDGEGCIMLTQYGGSNGSCIQLRVDICMTYEPIPKYFQECFGGSLMITPTSGNRKQVFRWRATGRNAGKFLEMILPHLVIKKDRAELGIQFQGRRKNRGSWRNESEIGQDKLDKETIQMLNHRGI